MTNKKTTLMIAISLICLMSLSFIYASVYVDNVDQDKLYPGQEANINVKIGNDFDYNVKDVKMNLIFYSFNSQGQIDLTKPLSFSPVGSSQDSVDEIDDDDSETLSFNIKASNSISPGDYNIAYQISYKNDNNTIVSETGSIGITVNSKTLLDYSISQTQKVIGMQDKVTLKIINKGFGDVKFVSVQINPNGYTLLSDSKVYIGSLASDDSDTASFDVILNKANPSFSAVVTYKDFENNDKSETINLDMTAYTKEKALQLGIIKKSNTPIVIGVVVFVVIVYFIIKIVRKVRKRKLSENKFNSSK